jgi:hypothetical protein
VEASLAGVVVGPRSTEALSYIERHLETPLGPLNGESSSDPYMSEYISPYISSWELLARLEHHDGAGALDLMRRLYGFMATHDPASTMWEKVGADGNPASYQPNQVGNALIPPNASVVGAGGVSLSHGWSTGPVSALSGYVLGLRPTSPGWATWTIEPQPVDLRFAQGQAGTPRGPIVSRWERGAADSTFRLTVAAPPGTRGTVALPLLGSERTIARDGRIVWQDGQPAGGASARLGAGEVIFDEGAGAPTYAWGPLAASAPASCPRPATRHRHRGRARRRSGPPARGEPASGGRRGAPRRGARPRRPACGHRPRRRVKARRSANSGV